MPLLNWQKLVQKICTDLEDAPEAAGIAASLEALRADVSAYAIADKTERQNALSDIRAKGVELAGEEADSVLVGGLMKSLEADVVRSSILKTGKRIDGRDTKTVRSIVSEVGLLPRTHGSALFTRGETQALAVATLGTGSR